VTSPRDVRPAALAVLALAALAVAVGGWEHAYLYHRGYSDIDTIGPLFLVNAVASLATVLVLLARRPVPFVVLSLAISIGSLVAIVLTRTTGLFGFEESGYDSRAVLTIVAEVAAVVLTVAGAALARGDLRGAPPSRAPAPARPGEAAR
jgi:hypothetical protein